MQPQSGHENQDLRYIDNIYSMCMQISSGRVADVSNFENLKNCRPFIAPKNSVGLEIGSIKFNLVQVNSSSR